MIDEDKTMQKEYERSESQRAWDECDKLRRELDFFRTIHPTERDLRLELHEAQNRVADLALENVELKERIAKLEAELKKTQLTDIKTRIPFQIEEDDLKGEDKASYESANPEICFEDFYDTKE